MIQVIKKIHGIRDMDTKDVLETDHEKVLDDMIESLPYDQSDGPKRQWVCGEESKYLSLVVSYPNDFSINIASKEYKNALMRHFDKENPGIDLSSKIIIWRKRPEIIDVDDLGFRIHSRFWFG